MNVVYCVYTFLPTHVRVPTCVQRLIVAASKPISEIVHYLALKWHLRPSKPEDMIHLYHTYNTELAVTSVGASALSLACQRVPQESIVALGTVLESKGSDTSSSANNPSLDSEKYLGNKSDLNPLARSVSELANIECDEITSASATVTPPPPHHFHLLENLPSLNMKEARLLDLLSECTVEDLHHKVTEQCFDVPGTCHFIHSNCSF